MACDIPDGPVDPELLKWYRARDVLLGRNCKWQDLEAGGRLASECSHVDAIWITGVFLKNRGVPKTWEEAQLWLRAEGDDPRAMEFAALIGGNRYVDEVLLLRAAEAGHALAQAVLAGRLEDLEEKFVWAQRAAHQGEPEGWYWLGYCFRNSWGVPKDLRRAVECDRYGAELGNAWLQYCVAQSYQDDRPEHFLWLGRATASGHAGYFFESCTRQMKAYVFNPTATLGCTIFQIGASLRGQNMVSGRLLFEKDVASANLAIKMHDLWCKLTRFALHSWGCVALRKGVSKDMRLMISEMIWESRREGLYLLDKNGEITRDVVADQEK
jgi:hypothetical protein